MAPSVAILLLLLWSWWPLGGRPHPLAASGQGSEAGEIQELLDRVRGQVSSGMEAEPTAAESLPHYQSPSGSGEAVDGDLGHSGSTYQAPRGQVSRKVFRRGCFGQRIDRISSVRGLGCNVLKPT
ncbi:natriuretic peptides B [Perognathus longimembris pacificus]|uniref:natriuretic peptides B n=1 Tax=Perognathus longimembris pacificus TaxID=214514 RepID=UPI002019CDA5|nr:natriuretic peptides B [Perognathus longimembris pacificus]